MKTTTELLEQNTHVGNTLDTETDPAVLRFFITARKAIRATLAARAELWERDYHAEVERRRATK